MSAPTGEADTDAPSSAALWSALGSLLDYLKPLVVLLILWEATATLSLVPQQALPHTYTVARTLFEQAQTGAFVQATWQTMYRATLAFALSIAVGVVVGLAMARSRAVAWFFDPIISVGFPIPKVTLVPVYVLWFGFGTLPAVLLAATSATFPVVIATYNGARAVDRELVWSARAMGVSKARTTWEVILPAALPEIFNGVQISLFLSFVVVVVAEMVTSAGGLGEVLTRSVRFFHTPITIAAVITVALLGLAFDRVFRALRSYLLAWTE